MMETGIRKDDVLERFIRSSGPGGQNVNKTSTCVYLKHIPTGIEVKCQAERSQSGNREIAWRILADKVMAAHKKAVLLERQRREKLRRRHRRRPQFLKERILESKRRQSDKKRLRSRVRDI